MEEGIVSPAGRYKRALEKQTDIMRPSLLVCFLGLIVLCRAQDSTLVKCARDTVDYRPPKNSDMNVTCGTDKMYLSILLCPIYFGGYNETLMALNSQFNTPGCQGTADLNTSSPVLKFSFGISKQGVNLCGNKLMITSEAGTGIFSQYSNVQQVNISGKINSYDPSAGTITYKQEVMYQFSCQYPLVYFVNNTELSVSGVSLAFKDNNGTFISTLSMSLYKDQGFTQPMSIPQNGLQLKTRIFVEIKATNLTDRFNVLLDRCYASTSPAPTNSTFYDLFVGCSKDIQTVVHLNGASQRAQFSFEAFRFTEHKNKTVSTFYLHCLTRLCENSTCTSMMPVKHHIHHSSYHSDPDERL
ncbi:zona pellucida-like domain-containing protein 1 [Alosa pseudoharengus]|uniref:zona pellucida-like domain-containing protein 1 n=1 Tax=Alosa pseudoharengus TaxID=34774 RepID=UPI003F8AE112